MDKKIIIYCSIVPSSTPPYSWYIAAEKLSKKYPVIFIDDFELDRKYRSIRSVVLGHLWLLKNSLKKNRFFLWNFEFPGSEYWLYFFLMFFKHIFKYEIILITNVPNHYPVFRFIPETASYFECTDHYSVNEFSNNQERIKFFNKVFTNTKLLTSKMKLFTHRVQQISSGYSDELELIEKKVSKIPKSVIFSGGISHRIDYSLLYQVVAELTDYQFFFMGEVYLNKYYIEEKDNDYLTKWHQLLSLPNVYYLGSFSSRESIHLLPIFEFGIIPYDVTDFMNQYCHPVKLYEYLSAGLIVISTKIASIVEQKKDLNIFAYDSSEEWIKTLTSTQHKELTLIEKKRIKRILQEQSVEKKIDQITKAINTEH